MKQSGFYSALIFILIGFILGNISKRIRTQAKPKEYTIDLPEEFTLSKEGDRLKVDKVQDSTFYLVFDNPQNN